MRLKLKIKLLLKKIVPFPHSRNIKYFFPFLFYKTLYNTLLLFGNQTISLQIAWMPQIFMKRVFQINIDEIKFVTFDESLSRLGKVGFCQPGDWDINSTVKRKSIFEEIAEGEPMAWHHITIQQLFLNGFKPKETLQYKLMIDNLKNQGNRFSQYNCKSVIEVDKYFFELINAFKSMQTDGYLTQIELGNNTEDEIPLYVTRNGSFTQVSGAQHRIRMAEILKITKLPCYVRGTHPSFLLAVCKRYKTPPHKAMERYLNEIEERAR